MDSHGTRGIKSTEFSEYNHGATVVFGGQTELHPHVRYAEDGDDGGTKQFGTLHSVHDPIPDDAVYGSPVYLLTERERGRLDDFGSGWEMVHGCIATTLQDRCETENRVLYPVYVESDSSVLFPTQTNWMWEFVSEHLPVSVHDCEWYYSGGRSIHCHVPLFTSKDGIDYLKEVSQDFDGELDSGIYSPKRQFRLPGVVHDENGLPKTGIDPEWRHDDPEEGHRGIIREAATTDPERPETYADLIRDVYGPDVLDRPEQFLWNPVVPDELKSEPHLWEPGSSKPAGDALGKWQRYNRHAYCPHAKAEGGTRSMALITYKGGAYGRDGDTYLPCEIWAAIGCDGQPWQNIVNCPVKLSKPDYEKIAGMNVESGDDLLIIGGRNHRSRILQLDYEAFDSTRIETAIYRESRPGDDYDREDTLQVIRECGYEPGSANRVDSKIPVKQESDGSTEAAALQSQAERYGIREITHDERRTVANRLLRVRGFNGAVEWFREQFGDEFKEDVTRKNLRELCDEYDDLPDV